MMAGLLYLKYMGFAHHDLSLENIVLTDEGSDHLQIIDLGMCFYAPFCVSSTSAVTLTDKTSRVLLSSQPCRGKPR